VRFDRRSLYSLLPLPLGAYVTWKAAEWYGVGSFRFALACATLGFVILCIPIAARLRVVRDRRSAQVGQGGAHAEDGGR
jgi:hypothetical protein